MVGCGPPARQPSRLLEAGLPAGCEERPRLPLGPGHPPYPGSKRRPPPFSVWNLRTRLVARPPSRCCMTSLAHACRRMRALTGITQGCPQYFCSSPGSARNQSSGQTGGGLIPTFSCIRDTIWRLVCICSCTHWTIQLGASVYFWIWDLGFPFFSFFSFLFPLSMPKSV